MSSINSAAQQLKDKERVDSLWNTRYTSAELLDMEFPEPVWIVDSVITEGLTILAGPPKVGKSWLTLNIASAVSVGGNALGQISVEERGVLYLALEDSPRRLQNRLNKLDALPSKKIHFINAWFRGERGINDLHNKLREENNYQFIVVDTLGKLRSVQTESSYSADYYEIGKFKEIADDLGISVLLVHHTRKAFSNDFIDDVSGTLGVTGAADTVITLKRGRGQADGFLNVTGRDVEENEFALRMDPDIGWEMMGEAEEYRESKETNEVIHLLKESVEPLSPKDIAENLGARYDSMKVKLGRMVKSGIIRREGHGKYVYVDTPK